MAHASCADDDTWVTPPLPLHEAVRCSYYSAYDYRLRHVRFQALSCKGTASLGVAASVAQVACSLRDVWLQVHCFYRLAWDSSVYRTVREPAVFWLHFAVMGGRPESNRRGPR